MNSQADICPSCNKPKTGKSGGLITQMLEVCLCDSIDLHATPQSKTCRNCRKPIGSSAAGSITQFVFSPGRCQCEVPEPMESTQSSASHPVFEGFLSREKEEPELELDSKYFPTDRYKPLLELGSGASGKVILCRDRLLGKKVAVKTLHQLSSDQLISFQDEAKATSLLNHPSIVRVLDFGVTRQSAPYLVMDYVDGESLEKRIHHGNRLSVSECIHIVAAISEALGYAHQHRVFHRDIKPSNVLLTYKNESYQVLLIDFGIAKIKEATGTVVYQGRTMAGTPAYMSPDTIRGYAYNERSEIYSLGCLLFEALEGHPPFAGETVLEVLYAHAEQPAPFSSNSEAPAGLKELLATMLAKEQDERPASMEAVRLALTSLVTESELPVGPVGFESAVQPDKTKGKVLAAGAGLCLFVISVLLIIVGMETPAIIGSGKVQSAKSSLSVNSTRADKELARHKLLKRWILKADPPSLELFAMGLKDNDLTLFKLNPKITDLDLSQNLLTGKSLHHLNSLKLNRLVLDDNPLTTIDGISKLSSLKDLSLGAVDLRKHKLDVLQDLPNLTSLGLLEAKLAEESLSSLPKLTHLTDLHLSGSRVNSKGLAYISKLPALKVLTLHECRNFDIAELHVLSNLKHLQELRLKGINLGGEKLLSLAKVKSLHVVSLRDCTNVPPQVLDSLALDLPDCAFPPLRPSSFNDEMISKANELFNVDKTAEAYELMKRSIGELENRHGKNGPFLCNPLMREAWFAALLGKENESFELSNRATKIAMTSGDNRLVKRMLEIRCYIFLDRRKFDLGDQSLKQWLTFCQKTGGDQESIADVYMAAGVMYSYQGKLDKAAENLEKCTTIYDQLENSPNLGRAHILLAEIYSRSGKLEKELQQYRICKKFTLPGSTDSIQADVRAGCALEQKGRLEEARTALVNAQEAIEQWDTTKQISESPIVIALYSSLAYLSEKEKRDNEALKFFDKAVAISQRRKRDAALHSITVEQRNALLKRIDKRKKAANGDP